MFQSLLLVCLIVCAVNAKIDKDKATKDFREAQKRNLEGIKRINSGKISLDDAWDTFKRMTKNREGEVVEEMKKKVESMVSGKQKDKIVHEIRMMESKIERFNKPGRSKKDGNKMFP